MNTKYLKIFLCLVSLSLISCKDKPTENFSELSGNYEITLSGWNGKMGTEDNIIQINADRSFSRSIISWMDSCGKLSSEDYDEIISELKSINSLQITLYHKSSCTDADGDKQTTKLVVTDKESNKINAIRWSDCENDKENKFLIEKLNLIRNNINGIIKNTNKHLCQ